MSPAGPAETGVVSATVADSHSIRKLHDAREKIVEQLSKVIVGQHSVIEELLISLFSRGHCLLEGVPGLAKTLLISTLARSLDLSFSRIQFTPDLMPADITGTEIIEENRSTGARERRFMEGPVFSHVILADEINRTPPKTQAALLEAMQERQVTVGRVRHPLTDPFFVLATQNPIELEGTYPLPEAQLDRFLFNVVLDYLTAEEELKVVVANASRVELPTINACTNAAEIVKFQWLVRQVPMSDTIARKAVELVRVTRPTDPAAIETVRKYTRYGASIRATQFLALAAKARALSEGRYHVTEEDLRALALPVLRHRVLTNYQAESDGVDADTMLRAVVQAVLPG
jgi:MoxR-like ATPase